MKISTSASFVVASIALSSSALALPVPQTDPIPYARSPDLAASPHAPHSARVFQESQMAGVARPGKGRPPAIRSGSGSRRSLPRRSSTLLKRGEENDKSLSDTVNGLLGNLESALAPFGLGLITPPAKESVGDDKDVFLQDDKDAIPHKAFRFARRIPQSGPPLSPPPIRAREEKATASEQSEGYFPFEIPGAEAGVPGVIQGEIPGFAAPGYAQPAYAGEPPFAMPIGGQPSVPEGFRGIPPQALGQLQTEGSNLPAGPGTVGEAAGEVPSELQNAVANTPAGGLLPGLPLGSVVGLLPVQVAQGGSPLDALKGLTPSQIQALAGLLGSTVGGVAGNAGLSNALGGVTGTLGGVTGSLPLVGGLNPFAALEGVPSNGKQESAGESASGEPPSESSTSSSSTSSSETASATTLPSSSPSAYPSDTETGEGSSSSSESGAEPTFVVNVGPDPAAVTSSHSLQAGSHSLPVPAPAQSVASEAPVPAPQAPSPPIINVEAPSPTPSQSESATETSSFSEPSSSATDSSSSSSESPSASMSTSSTSSTDAAESTSSSTVNPVERRRLLSRIMRHFRREDPPLPKGFAAPTGPIPGDTPPLLKSVVDYPADKVEKDQAPASSSVTSSAASESESVSCDESSSESTVSHEESTSISTA